jgi:hypothetical protein
MARCWLIALLPFARAGENDDLMPKLPGRSMITRGVLLSLPAVAYFFSGIARSSDGEQQSPLPCTVAPATPSEGEPTEGTSNLGSGVEPSGAGATETEGGVQAEA